jgi:hypothetical protein
MHCPFNSFPLKMISHLRNMKSSEPNEFCTHLLHFCINTLNCFSFVNFLTNIQWQNNTCMHTNTLSSWRLIGKLIYTMDQRSSKQLSVNSEKHGEKQHYILPSLPSFPTRALYTVTCNIRQVEIWEVQWWNMEKGTVFLWNVRICWITHYTM